MEKLIFLAVWPTVVDQVNVEFIVAVKIEKGEEDTRPYGLRHKEVLPDRPGVICKNSSPTFSVTSSNQGDSDEAVGTTMTGAGRLQLANSPNRRSNSRPRIVIKDLKSQSSPNGSDRTLSFHQRLEESFRLVQRFLIFSLRI